jgi:glycosyltransferase involved in cell wall biosynthesis
MAPAETRRSSTEEAQAGPPATILYFGNDWNAENRTSSHHIARQLAERCQVYYIECPGLRAPSVSGRDVKKIFTKLFKGLRGPRQVSERIKVKTLLQIPFHRFAIVRWLNRLLVKASMRWMMWRHGIRKPISWFVIPHLPYLIGALDERLAVYYCIDDYPAMPGVNREVVTAMDAEMTRRADVVFVSSETLKEPKAKLNPNTHHSPHGVDVDHFGRAQSPEQPVAPEVAALPKPVIGFFGLIERWIELDLIAYLAEQRPQWSFVLIGRAAVPAEQLPQRPNIHYLGKRPYEDLPAYGKGFDVSIIPYHLTYQVLNSSPLKLREYLAMGKPIVSVSVPEIDKFADVVAIARTREEYLAALDRAVAEKESPEAIARRMNRVRGDSWSARVDNVLAIVNQQESGARDQESGVSGQGSGVTEQASREPIATHS